MAHKTYHWRSVDGLPLRTENPAGWSCRRANGPERKINKEGAQNIARNWMPASTDLVAPPHSLILLPPILVEELQSDALWSAKKASMNFIFMSGALSLFLSTCLAFYGWHEFWKITLLSWLLTSMFVLDHQLCASSVRGLIERSLFLISVKSQCKGYWIWPCTLAAMAVSQLLSTHILGSIESTFEHYGLIYDRAANGEYWRLLTGPFLHYSISHFLLNTALLLFAGLLASHIHGYISWIYFIIITTLSGYLQWSFGPDQLNSFGGISGGAYGLFGSIIGSALMTRSTLPLSVLVIVINSTLIGIVSSALLNENSANYAHIGGLAAGLMIGMLMDLYIHQDTSGPSN